MNALSYFLDPADIRDMAVDEKKEEESEDEVVIEDFDDWCVQVCQELWSRPFICYIRAYEILIQIVDQMKFSFGS